MKLFEKMRSPREETWREKRSGLRTEFCGISTKIDTEVTRDVRGEAGKGRVTEAK